MPLSAKLKPPGTDPPVIEIAGTGKPVVVTVKVPATPSVNVVEGALVIMGAVPTARTPAGNNASVSNAAPMMLARRRRETPCMAHPLWRTRPEQRGRQWSDGSAAS